MVLVYAGKVPAAYDTVMTHWEQYRQVTRSVGCISADLERNPRFLTRANSLICESLFPHLKIWVVLATASVGDFED